MSLPNVYFDQICIRCSSCYFSLYLQTEYDKLWDALRNHVTARDKLLIRNCYKKFSWSRHVYTSYGPYSEFAPLHIMRTRKVFHHIHIFNDFLSHLDLWPQTQGHASGSLRETINICFYHFGIVEVYLGKNNVISLITNYLIISYDLDLWPFKVIYWHGHGIYM